MNSPNYNLDDIILRLETGDFDGAEESLITALSTGDDVKSAPDGPRTEDTASDDESVNVENTESAAEDSPEETWVDETPPTEDTESMDDDVPADEHDEVSDTDITDEVFDDSDSFEEEPAGVTDVEGDVSGESDNIPRLDLFGHLSDENPDTDDDGLDDGDISDSEDGAGSDDPADDGFSFDSFGSPDSFDSPDEDVENDDDPADEVSPENLFDGVINGDGTEDENTQEGLFDGVINSDEAEESPAYAVTAGSNLLYPAPADESDDDVESAVDADDSDESEPTSRPYTLELGSNTLSYADADDFRDSDAVTNDHDSGEDIIDATDDNDDVVESDGTPLVVSPELAKAMEDVSDIPTHSFLAPFALAMFFPMGFMSMGYSLDTLKHMQNYDVEAAEESSSKAAAWGWAAVIAGTLLIALFSAIAIDRQIDFIPFLP